MKRFLIHLFIFTLLALGPKAIWNVGFASNALVMAVNNNQMPVLVPGGCTPEIQERMSAEADLEGVQVHSCMTTETHLKVLADWIFVRHLGVFSIGDGLEMIAEHLDAPFYDFFLAYFFYLFFFAATKDILHPKGS